MKAVLSARSGYSAAPRQGEDHPGQRPRLEPGWPLVWLFAGIPLWWVLGTFQIAFFVFAIPMLAHLLRQRRVLVPAGFGLWLLLLIWVIGGVLVLQVDAPGAIPGESMARYLTFGFRFGWYVCATIALLYVVNTAATLRTERISFALGWMFVSLVGGGLLASLVPALDFITPIELLLPRSLATNEFVQGLVHAQVAQLQDFLGYVEPRPSAPFPFANQWGIAMAVTAPHFIVGWWARGGIYRRVTPLIGAIAVVPLIGSLNRGMWAAFIVMAIYALARAKLYRRPAVLVGVVGGLTIAATAIWMSPLGALIIERLNTPHSDEGRGNLGTLTVESVLQGSPVMGFGTTRDVQGNFNSIAAGSTADCPACSPSPLGTQGNLWELIFGAGFVGLCLYLVFMASLLLRYGRLSSPLAIASQCTVLAALVTSPVYNLVHPAIVVLLIAIGILVREHGPPTRELAQMVRPLRRGIPIILAIALLGAAVGGAIQAERGTSAQATQRVLVPETNLVGDPSTRPLTLDSEALLVTSRTVLEQAAASSGIDPGDLAGRTSITALPNTRILVIHVAAATPAIASAQVQELAQAYLDLRGVMATEARELLRTSYEAELRDLAVAIATVESALQRDTSDNAQLTAALISLQQQSGSIASDLDALEGDLDVGQLASQARALTPIDPWVVALSSGLMVGLLIGLCVAWLTDGRIPRVHSNRRIPPDLPVVDRVATNEREPLERSIERAAQVVGVYAPLAGVLADASSPASSLLGSRLDDSLQGNVRRRGQRLLLVTTRTAPPHRLETTRRDAERAGLNPVGVIVVDS